VFGGVDLEMAVHAEAFHEINLALMLFSLST
jgi:hypothetical protein